MPAIVQFLAVAEIKGISFNPLRPEGLTFQLPEPDQADIVITPNGEDGGGHWTGLTAKTRLPLPTSGEAYEFVSQLIQGRFLPYGDNRVELPRIVRGEVRVDGEGRLSKGYYPPLNICPAEIQDLVRLANARLHEVLTRFLGLLRWRQDMQAQHRLIERTSLYWGVGKELHHVPLTNASQTFPTMTGIAWNEADQEAMTALWQSRNLAEPLAHEILREAAALARTSPRSSILIAAAALEAGVKSHCGTLVPNSTWLLENVSSPPIPKMLRDYIPQLHERRGVDVGFWKEFFPVIKAIERFVAVRNKLAHTGKIPDKSEPLSEYIQNISDILYALDVFSGQEWAKERVRGSIRKALNWPEPSRPEVIITLSPSE